MTSVDVGNVHSLERRSRVTATVTLLGALLTLAVLVYAAVELRDLMERVEAKRQEVSQLQETAELRQRQIGLLEGQISELKVTLEGARQVVALVRDGINAYHQGAYRAAVDAYQRAIELDPRNPYVHNLKGYSLFKLGRYEEAIAAFEDAVESDPDYAWGYFDLARASCAAGDLDLAKQAREKAIELRGGLVEIMEKDGEFTRLCAPILP